METVVFLIGVMDKNVGRTGYDISQTDFAMIDGIARKLEVRAPIVVAVQDAAYAGKAAKATMAVIRAHRDRVFAQLATINPNVVIACGPVALKCLLNKGNVTLDEHLRTNLTVPELPDVVCVATQSLEMIAAKPGTEKHVLLDVQAALYGRLKTKWGKYVILQPDTTEWHRCPVELQTATQVGLDLETYPGLDPWHPEARIRMAVISDKLGRAWVVQATKDSRLPEWLVRIAATGAVECGGSNIKFDYRWLHRFGYALTNMFDTSTAEHILDSSSALTDLKSLTFLYAPKLGDYSKGHRKLVAERGGWEFVEDHEMYLYCGADGEASIATMKAQKKALKQRGLTRPHKLSKALYHVLADMETRGLCVNMDTHRELDTKFSAALSEQTALLMDTLGPINMNSHQQLAKALIQAVPGIQLTEAKVVRQFAETPYRLHAKEDPDQYTTDKAVLEREAHRHPVVGQLLLYRRLAKLYGTYVRGLREKHIVRHPDGLYYVHTSYRSDKAETGRLSSQGPNLQNLPRKPEPDDAYPIPLELNVKRQFCSRWPGGSIIEADEGQAEIRVAAGISNDRALLAALTSGLDVHTAMCAQFHNKSADLVTKLERTHGKRQTFRVIYGGGSNSLSEALGVPKTEAQQLLNRFFETYPELNRYIQGAKLEVKRDLYSECIFGYRRQFRKPARWDSPEGWRIERQAWNHRVQTPAACMVFAAKIDLEAAMKAARMQSVIVAQVHDSVVVDAYPGEQEEVVKLMRKAMTQPDLERWGVNLNVPLTTDIEIGANWGDKQLVEAA